MSAEDAAYPPRPLSVAIPTSAGSHGVYSARRPNLREILANTSPPPWTLAAFMAYLSSNHCLETLEFTMDAGRYKKHYAKMMSRVSEGGAPPEKDQDYVRALWQRLVEAYIEPNGSREVNLPSSVRDPILSLKPTSHPPAPEALDPAVAKIYELMEESVLVPFLNSVYPQSAHTSTLSTWPGNASTESLSSRTQEERSFYSRRPRHGTNAPQLQHSYSNSAPSRKSAPVPLVAPTHRSRFSTKLSPTTSAPSGLWSNSTIDESIGDASENAGASSSGDRGMTDDSGSNSSPAHDSPMTPPVSPHMSDAHSPKRDSGMWKKLGRLSKVGRKKSHGGLKEDQ